MSDQQDFVSPLHAASNTMMVASLFCERHGDESVEGLARRLQHLGDHLDESDEELLPVVNLAQALITEAWCVDSWTPNKDSNHRTRDGEVAEFANPLGWFMDSQREHLSAETNRYIVALSESPMRLYQVSQAVPGRSATFVDLVDQKTPPITVTKGHGYQFVKPGMVFAARLLNLGSAFSTSVGLLQFDPRQASNLVELLKKSVEDLGERVVKRRRLPDLATPLLFAWPVHTRIVPDLSGNKAGDRLVMITEKYKIHDRGMLSRLLGTTAGVQQTGPNSWFWFGKSKADWTASVFVEKNGELHAFFRSEEDAAFGNGWLPSVVGSSVKFLGKEVSTVEDAMNDIRANPEKYEAMAREQQAQVPPDVLQKLIEQSYAEQYKDWESTPLPMIDNMTPLEACKTPNGKNRVKGILHMYEENEERLARQMNRTPISLDFMWKKVGLKREA